MSLEQHIADLDASATRMIAILEKLLEKVDNLAEQPVSSSATTTKAPAASTSPPAEAVAEEPFDKNAFITAAIRYAEKNGQDTLIQRMNALDSSAGKLTDLSLDHQKALYKEMTA